MFIMTTRLTSGVLVFYSLFDISFLFSDDFAIFQLFEVLGLKNPAAWKGEEAHDSDPLLNYLLVRIE